MGWREKGRYEVYDSPPSTTTVSVRLIPNIPTSPLPLDLSAGPRHNIAKEVFDAHRNKDCDRFVISPNQTGTAKWFWNPYYATPNRRINYKKQQHLDWWQNYRDYRTSLTRLTTDYGNIDILWLDGGWITGDEIGLDTILQMPASATGYDQADRTIRGKNENYQTPEQGIPAKQLDIHSGKAASPLSHAWGWTPNAKFKSPTR